MRGEGSSWNGRLRGTVKGEASRTKNKFRKGFGKKKKRGDMVAEENRTGGGIARSAGVSGTANRNK